MANTAVLSVAASSIALQSTTYTITPSSTSVAEGGEVTFTIRRSGDEPEETVYFSAWQSSASYDERDYEMEGGRRPEDIAVHFEAGDSSETVTMSILQDGQADAGERFRAIVQADPPSSDPADNLDATDYITITEAVQNTTYTITPSSTSVAEGGEVTFTIRRSGDEPEETVYFSAWQSSASYDERDYEMEGGGRPEDIAVHFEAGDSSETVTMSILQDGQADAGERFRAIVQADPPSSDPADNLDATDYIAITEAVQNTTYTITPSSTSVAEGGEVTFTIRRSGDEPEETVYFSAWQSSASYDERDYEMEGGGRPEDIAVHFEAGDSSETVTMSILQDGQADAGERFRAIVQADPPSSDPADNLDATDYITITEAGSPPPVTDDYRDEPTDTSSPLKELFVDNSIGGFIGPADANDTHGDKDLFKITLVKDQTYILTMVGAAVNGASALAQSIFTVRGATTFNTILATSSEGATAFLEFQAPFSGDYYVRTGSGGLNYTTAQGGYELELRSAENPAGEVDPDGTMNISSIIESSDSYSYSGHVGGGDPSDLFKLTAPASGQLKIDLTNLKADIDLSILNDSGGRLGLSNESGAASEQLSIALAPGETIYIRVYPYLSAQSSYTLKVGLERSEAPPATPLPSSATLIGDHLHLTLAEFAAAAYLNDVGHATLDGWQFYSSSSATTSAAEAALAQLMGPSGVYQSGNAAAVIARADDAIVISFRGTDNLLTLENLHWFGMTDHYQLFQPLLGALEELIGTQPWIKHVYVTGHSLGAAMVDLYMKENSDTVAVDFTAMTFAHPDVVGLPFVAQRDDRITSFHNSQDIVNLFDLPDTGRIPGLENVIHYTGQTGIAHSINLYLQGVTFLSNSGIGDRIMSLGLNGPGHNYFLVPSSGTGVDNTLESRKGGLLMIGGNGSDSYDTVPIGRQAGDTIIEQGGIADTLRLRTAPLVVGDLGWFRGTVWLEQGPNGTDLLVHPIRVDGVNLPVIRIYNHFSSLGRVESIQWADHWIALPASPGAIDGWNGAYYKSVSLANVRYVEGNDGSIIGSIGAAGGSGSTDTVSFGGLRNSVTASLIDGVASIIDSLFPPQNLQKTGLTGLAAGSTGPISVDISRMENIIGGDAADDLAGNNLSNALLGGRGDDRLDGGAGTDLLDGGPGNDRLIGNTGADSMMGGTGNDLHYVDHASDWIVELANEGSADRVYASISYDLPSGAYVEILSTNSSTGTAPIALTGNELDNLLYGNAGNNRLIGMGGGDLLIGFGGNDVYSVDSARDRVKESAGGGNDRVYASVSYQLALGEHIESLYAAIANAITRLTLTGNELNNALYGNAGANVLKGGGGNDRLEGGLGDDVLAGGSGNDRVDGGAGDDTAAYGDATAGVFVDLALTGPQNTVGSGTDTLIGIQNIAGSAFVDVLRGNSADNRMHGAAGNDHLFGNAGNDVLDGGAGSDAMTGGAGNDTYGVDNSNDHIAEGTNGGSDRVNTAVSYTLGRGVHVELLAASPASGTAALVLAGNEFANTIYGNAGNNTLYGMGGADTLVGLKGNDSYIVDNALDKVIEASAGGNDQVRTSVSYTLAAGQQVETLATTNPSGTGAIKLTGNEFANVLYGNAGANTLSGGAGGDTLVGGAGHDKLYGGTGHDGLQGASGADGFYFHTALGATNVDKILDYSVAADTIYLMRSVFTKAGANGTLAASAFHKGTTAHDSSDRIVYDQAAGKILYDPDGTGSAAAVLFATVAAGTPLTNADFVIFG